MGNEHEIDDDTGDVDLSAYATALRNPSVWAPLPADLGGRILAAVDAERVVGDHERVAAASEPAARGTTTGTRRWIPRVLVPVAAALVLAFGAGLWLGNRDDAGVAGDDPADAAAGVTLSGTALAPEATATGLIFDRGAGYSIRLHVDGLSPAPQGEYYEGWLQSVAGDLVSVGTFHMRGGDGSVVLWSGVGVDDYPTLLVTEQVEGQEASSPQVVLAGPVA
jgi:hypothetical protein